MFSFLSQKREEIHRDSTEILADASRCLGSEDYEGALKFFDELCGLPVQSALPFLSRATCNMQLKRWKEAIKDCEKVLLFLNTEIDNKVAEGCRTIHSVALIRMAKAYKELGDLEKSNSALIKKDAIENKFKKSKTTTSKSSSETLNGEDERETAEEQREAEKCREQGNVLYKQGNIKDALVAYRKGLSFDMYNEKLHSNACLCLIKQNDLVMAGRHADQVATLQPEWAKGPYLQGRVLALQGKYFEAKEHYKKSLKLDPSNKVVKNALSDLDKNHKDDISSSTLRNRKQKANKSDNAAELSDSDDDADPSAKEKAGIRIGIPSVNTIVEYSKSFATGSGLEILAAALGILLTWAVVASSK
ncbi:Hsp70-Hsp90 organizing protein [Zancudomyces culisetae]|uniref:Hsp70-Hsp90 organizing protein n=1 Tax=Zancudomyces culisetae TaxID=1213189 RepID=A0A1R1PVJ3_ZANCU|nr:Hsp70-Hsp90 organizing protein [Zancudomyces culisetae]OMH84996.1 Hsp70-Hsp90 organizing protein [Zancudomyces culisetae]|eukprot:OMH78572.1 Hsp70-Hsp90 organizing protein [Zancudomyces culisetae]